MIEWLEITLAVILLLCVGWLIQQARPGKFNNRKGKADDK